MEHKTITVLAMVLVGAAVYAVPGLALPILKTLTGAAIVSIIADLHESKKRKK